MRLLLFLPALVGARIHSLNIQDDPRVAFSIESFGFADGGSVDLDVHDVSVYPETDDAKIGFVIYPAMTEAAVNEHIDALLAKGQCALDEPPAGSSVIDLSKKSTWKDYRNSYEVFGTGMFDVMFMRCNPSGVDATVTFTMEAAFVNPGPNYLSVGDMPLPIIYTIMSVAFAAALVLWFRHLRANKAETTRVHHLMTALLLAKTLDVVFEAAMYYYIASTGHNSAWNSMFYFFSFVKGGLMAVVTLLVGAGWSILKPFVSDREKKILIVALVLQLLTNTAIVMTDELAPGSIAFLAWADVLHIADLIASAAVIVPIAWSMRALQQAQGSGGDSDGKAAETLNRLAMFRNFYLATIAYVYFTRFLLYVLSSTLPYNYTWFAPLADELATLAYYVTVGYRFRPDATNAYLRVSGDDDEDTGSGVATGAAAGTLEGGATAVQTLAATKKAPQHVIEEDDDDLEAGLDLDSDEEGDGKKLVKKEGAAPAKPAPPPPEQPKMKQVNKARDGK